jgi:hypothetical protein
MMNLMSVNFIEQRVKLQTIHYIGVLKKNISLFYKSFEIPVGFNQAMPSLNFNDFKVFTISMVTVIGPTPPGTGVM